MNSGQNTQSITKNKIPKEGYKEKWLKQYD